MAQYPVEDQAGITEAVNYLLSGPSGLGQNFAGFSDYRPSYFNGTYRRAFSVPALVSLTTNNLSVVGGNKPALGSTTTYSNVSATSSSGIGDGVVVDVTLTATGATTYDNSNTTISVVIGGSNYLNGDQLVIDGADIGGVSVTDDLTLLVTVTPPAWYVAPLTITGITQVSAYAFELTFAAQPSPPFFPGQYVIISGSTAAGADPDFYNSDWTVPGVLDCTTTSVTIGTQNAYTFPAWVSGGTVEVNIATNTDVSTDCNARVTVIGGTDQVFVSAQLRLDFDYTVINPGNLTLTVKVNRYYAELDTRSPTNRDYIFLPYPNDDPISSSNPTNYTVSEQSETYALTTSGTQTSRDFVFTTVLDSNLPKNYYWYILEINLLPDVIDDIVVNSVTGGLRSLTAQVIKQ